MYDRPRSRFVTNLAVSSIGICIIMTAMDLSTLSTLNSLSNSPEAQLMEQYMPSLAISPTETILDMLLYLAGAVASFMMFRRSNVGRLAFMGVVTVGTLWSIASSISAYYSVAEYLRAFGMGGSLSLLVLGAVFGVAINVAIVWKLSRPDIVQEFTAQQ